MFLRREGFGAFLGEEGSGMYPSFPELVVDLKAIRGRPSPPPLRSWAEDFPQVRSGLPSRRHAGSAPARCEAKFFGTPPVTMCKGTDRQDATHPLNAHRLHGVTEAGLRVTAGTPIADAIIDQGIAAALADGFLFRSPVAFLRDGFSSPAYLWLSLETLSG